MAKPIRSLLIALLVVLLLGTGAWWLLRQPAPSEAKTDYLMQKPMTEVASVSVQNQHSSYLATQTAESVSIHDLPPALLNLEYAAMLFDEASNIRYTQVVEESPSDLSLYGLQTPVATVDIAYTDNTTLQLLVGEEEPVSGGRYLKTSTDSTVYLVPNNRTIRFTMPVERYLDFVIIEPNKTPAVLSAVQDITFSGSQLPSPIVLKAVLADRADILRTASSFGAATHLIVEPQLHEADQTELIRLTESLLGLISEGVVDYNCTPEDLADYGFDAPVLQVEFDYKNGKDAPVAHHILKLAQLDGDYIATLDDWGVVYRIAPVDFTTVNYEALVLRWFLSPFITDVKQLEVTLGTDSHVYDMEGDSARELVAKLGEKQLDSELFRQYYNLVVSAAASEALPLDTVPQGSPIAEIRFAYKDSQKPDDVLRLFAGSTRRLTVEVNGTATFAMKETFLPALQAATNSLEDGESFSVQW